MNKQKNNKSIKKNQNGGFMVNLVQNLMLCEINDL